MTHLAPHHPKPTLTLFAPPYRDFEPIEPGWMPQMLPPRGSTVLWRVVDAAEQEPEFEWLRNRPPGLPLLVVMPEPEAVSPAAPLLPRLGALAPRDMLPPGSVIAPLRVRELVAAPPRRLATAVMAYLARRGLLPTARVRETVERVFELAPRVSSISKLAGKLCVSRRTLGRRFKAVGLPVPSHWLQFARLMHVAVQLQSQDSTLFRIARRGGYPDGFTMSNQMKRLLGCRPSEVRRCLGWEWIAEQWIHREAVHGGFDPVLQQQAVRPYLASATGDGADGRTGSDLARTERPEREHRRRA